MNLWQHYWLILLALYLSMNSVSAVTIHKNYTVNDLFKPHIFGTDLTNGSSATYTFSGATADYINYVQLCMATDNTCSSCGAPYATYKMLTSNNGIAYDTVGTAWGIQASSIQNYLTNNGYGDGTYLYAGKSNGLSMFSCPVTITSGTISIGTCAIKSSGGPFTKGIALNPSGTNVYTAIQATTGLITSCPASPGAAINNNCTNTNSSGITTSGQGAAWGNVVGP